MKKKYAVKMWSILLALILITSLSAGALAADIELENGLPASTPITVNTTVIGFAGQEWWVIG